MEGKQVPPQAAILHIIANYWLSRTVYLAARLKLADAIGDGKASLRVVDELERLLDSGAAPATA